MPFHSVGRSNSGSVHFVEVTGSGTVPEDLENPIFAWEPPRTKFIAWKGHFTLGTFKFWIRPLYGGHWLQDGSQGPGKPDFRMGASTNKMHCLERPFHSMGPSNSGSGLFMGVTGSRTVPRDLENLIFAWEPPEAKFIAWKCHLTLGDGQILDQATFWASRPPETISLAKLSEARVG